MIRFISSLSVKIEEWTNDKTDSRSDSFNAVNEQSSAMDFDEFRIDFNGLQWVSMDCNARNNVRSPLITEINSIY